MSKLLSGFVISLSVLVAVSYLGPWRDLVSDIYQGFISPPERFFWWGLGGGTLVVWLLRRRLRFFSTFEHEITHILVGLLFFKSPSSLEVSDSGNGMVALTGRNFLIVLAPYFLPTITLLLLPLWWLIDERFQLIYFCLLGISLGYHFVSTLEETGSHQTDLQSCGVTFSYIVLVTGNIFFIGLVLSFVLQPADGLWDFVKAGPLQMIDWFGRRFG